MRRIIQDYVVREDGYTLRPSASGAHSNKVNEGFLVTLFLLIYVDLSCIVWRSFFGKLFYIHILIYFLYIHLSNIRFFNIIAVQLLLSFLFPVI